MMKLSDLDLSKSYTYSDYLMWQFKERLELIRGRVFKMYPAPSSEHQEISFSLSGMMFNYFRKRPCKVYAAPFDVRFMKKDDPSGEAKTVLQPDLCVVCDLSKIDKAGCLGAPDLVVEILSPGNSKREMKDKFEIYEEHGVKEYWIVNPLEENVLQYIINEERAFVGLKPTTKGDQLASHLFPGLTIDLEEVFPEKNEESAE